MVQRRPEFSLTITAPWQPKRFSHSPSSSMESPWAPVVRPRGAATSSAEVDVEVWLEIGLPRVVEISGPTAIRVEPWVAAIITGHTSMPLPSTISTSHRTTVVTEVVGEVEAQGNGTQGRTIIRAQTLQLPPTLEVAATFIITNSSHS